MIQFVEDQQLDFMKLFLKNSKDIVNQRLSVLRNKVPCIDSSWHYHSQFELLYVTKSSGIRFVGDSVASFHPGDLVLVGAYVPHLWRNDASFYDHKNEGNKQVETTVLKFKKEFISVETFERPEFIEIRELLDESKFGVSFGSEITEELHDTLAKIVKMPLANQSIHLMEILLKLARTNDKVRLSNTDMRQVVPHKTDKLDTVLKYISDNYTQNISLEDVSNLACMTPNSFCRFFKKMTNKSFVQFLNEVRIKKALRYLVHKEKSVSEICYLVGYNSINNFNKQFKLAMGSTPNEYRYYNMIGD
ncbi:AraC family transcriptional regulator [Flavicella marina]|uniref:AraC family transcriptional regulator n=1 Tax=Flavicella marina TaxID=1475951 RepID=UPI001D010619|nr:AraC family transcriptional regulator [Flavicella marina]